MSLSVMIDMMKRNETNGAEKVKKNEFVLPNM